MIEGNLKKVSFNEQAAVLTYKVPSGYGGYSEKYPDKVRKEDAGTAVDLSAAYRLKEKHGDALRIYPGSMVLRDGQTYSGNSRTVACVGVADSIEKARFISQEAAKAIKGGGLWYRTDVASGPHINKSITHMKELRP
jgi:phosphoribosylamine--glycine ligase